MSSNMSSDITTMPWLNPRGVIRTYWKEKENVTAYTVRDILLWDTSTST